MPLSTLSVESPGGQSPLSEKTLAGSALNFSTRRKLRDLGAYLYALIGGVAKRTTKIRYGETFAFGTATFSGASGTVGVLLGGNAITFAHGASDQADSNTLVTTINASANALVQDLIKASNLKATITISTGVAGAVLTIMDVVLRAVKTGVSSPEAGEFAIGASDTLTAVNLVAAINNHPVLRESCVATSSLGVVTVYSVFAVPDYTSLTSSGSGFTASGAFAAGTTVMLTSLWKGTLGNHITLALSGTGVTVSGARFTGGTNGTTSII